MNRPDAMDLDVAALLGLDAASFVQPPRASRPMRMVRPAARPAKAKAKAKGKSGAWTIGAPRSPWPWLIVPLAAALAVGAGMSWGPDKEEPPPQQTAAQAVAPEPAFRSAGTPRAMSLKIIDGPRPAARAAADQRQRPRNIPMAELGPMPTDVASHEAAPGSEGAPSAPPAQVLDVEPMALFGDEELAPHLAGQDPGAPEPAAP